MENTSNQLLGTKDVSKLKELGMDKAIIKPAKVTTEELMEELPIDIRKIVKNTPKKYKDMNAVPAIPIDDIDLFGDVVGVLVSQVNSGVVGANLISNLSLDAFTTVISVGSGCSLDVSKGDIVSIENCAITGQYQPVAIFPIFNTEKQKHYVCVIPSTYIVARIKQGNIKL